MLMPSIFGENLFDDFFGFDYPTRRMPAPRAHDLMKTDVQELDNAYQLDISLPGFKKEDLTAELKDGYLTVSAQTSAQNDEKDEKTGKYIRRERYSGSCKRSFYVGEEVTQEDIKAKYENGILTLNVPKKEALPKKEEKQFIAIEG